MRIIDKNRDFYDYLQGIYPDNLITFDRRGSFVIRKNDFMRLLVPQDIQPYSGRICHRYNLNTANTDYLVLQAGYHYWIIAVKITETIGDGVCQVCANYELKLLDHAIDYSKPAAAPISIRLIDDYKLPFKTDTEYIIRAIKNNECRSVDVVHRLTRVYNNTPYPIVADLGIGALVNAEDVYFALDEYFSKQITNNERTESTDITDKEKIINHGFDTKTSFRGKNK